jgi:glycosyltransferase involved in cell wall biosynthesis
MDGPVWRPYGAPRVVYEYANRLAARGHQVTVAHANRLTHPPAARNVQHWLKDRTREARNILLAWGGLGRRRVRWHAIDPKVRMIFVPNLRPQHIPDGDAVIASQETAAEDAAQYPSAKGTKFHLVQTYPGFGGLRDRTNQTWRIPLHKIVVARWLFQIGLDLGCRPEEMTYIPNGVDANRYRLLDSVEHRPKRVAMLYSLHQSKGSGDAIRALEAAKVVHPDLQAVIFGTYRRRKSVPSWADFRFDPPQDEIVPKIYNGSRILLFPSWREGFPLLPSEAMACGCALVATDIPGIREFAGHGKNALLSPPGDVEALTRNLLCLLDDDALRIRLARAGRETIKQFTWERSTDLLEELLKTQVAGQEATGAPVLE